MSNIDNDTVTIRRDDFEVMYEYCIDKGNAKVSARSERAMRLAVKTNEVFKTLKQKEKIDIQKDIWRYGYLRRLSYGIINNFRGLEFMVNGTISGVLPEPKAARVIGPVWVSGDGHQIKEKGLVMMECSTQIWWQMPFDQLYYGSGAVHCANGNVSYRFPAYADDIVIPEHLKHKLIYLGNVDGSN